MAKSTAKLKGDLYEDQICTYLNLNGYVAYKWSNIPGKVLLDSDILTNLEVFRLQRKVHKLYPNAFTNPLIDIGVDILAHKKWEILLRSV